MTTKRYGLALSLFLLVAILLLASGCGLEAAEVGPLQTEEQSVERNDASSVRSEINLGAGRLDVSGGASSLLEATFTYNVADWKPEVEYSVSDGEGDLTISQPTIEGANNILVRRPDDVRYEWDLRFDDSVPMEMIVKMGAGEGNMELDSLSIESLDFEGGAGDVEIDLSGGTAQDLDFTLGAGEVKIDLSGDWNEDLSANLQGGVGKVTLLLPSSSGVRVEVQGGLGSVSAVGLGKDGNVYTNDAYGDSDVTLDIEIKGGIGEINLEVVD